jgi:hypothetical protein
MNRCYLCGKEKEEAELFWNQYIDWTENECDWLECEECLEMPADYHRKILASRTKNAAV